jgi:hypothetical protein
MFSFRAVDDAKVGDAVLLRGEPRRFGPASGGSVARKRWPAQPEQEGSEPASREPTLLHRLETPMRIVPGKAQLEIYPHLWPRPSVEAATAILSALWKAHPCIMAVKLDYNDPPITVDVAIPTDGSLDLYALQQQLQEAVRKATTPSSQC